MVRSTPHLQRGDERAEVDRVPAGVGRVNGRSLGDGKREKESLFTAVVALVARLHAVQELLRYGARLIVREIKGKGRVNVRAEAFIIRSPHNVSCEGENRRWVKCS